MIFDSIKMPLKLVLKGPVNTIPALDQIMAWRLSAAKPLSEPKRVSWLTQICVTLLTYICVTRSQYVSLGLSELTQLRVCVLMMTSSNGNIFRVTGPLCGEFTGPGEFPARRPVTRMFSLICAWINGWVNNCEAGDLRRHRDHYDVNVML